jgi:hypothetical protein
MEAWQCRSRGHCSPRSGWRRMLHATCCTSHAARCMLHVACCTSHAARRMLYAACTLLPETTTPPDAAVPSPVPAQCGSGEPGPGADVAGASPVPVLMQMWRRGICKTERHGGPSTHCLGPG